MSSRLLPYLGVVSVALLASSALGQVPSPAIPSHREIALPNNGLGSEELLQQQLKLLRGDPASLDEALKRLGAGQGGESLPPGLREAIERMFKGREGVQGPIPTMPPPGLRQPPVTQPEERDAPPKLIPQEWRGGLPQLPKMGELARLPDAGPDGLPNAPGSRFDERMYDWMRRAAERLQDVEGLRDSPGLQQTIEYFNQMSIQSAGRPSGMGRALDWLSDRPELRDAGNRFGDGLQRWIGGREWRLPSLPNWRLPRVSAPRLPQPSVGGGFSSVPSGSGDGWQALVWVGLVLLVGLAAWRYLRVGSFGGGAAGREEGLGRWPVSPGAVRTRDELVRAFDYLAVLLLGRAARHWHHRAIADRVAETRPQHGDSARGLAGLYERARYAPVHEELSEAEMADARRQLCLLAHGGAA